MPPNSVYIETPCALTPAGPQITGLASTPKPSVDLLLAASRGSEGSGDIPQPPPRLQPETHRHLSQLLILVWLTSRPLFPFLDPASQESRWQATR